ncbi:hypothetical protein R50071_42750 [Halioxenophilus aromaticivorans]
MNSARPRTDVGSANTGLSASFTTGVNGMQSAGGQILNSAQNIATSYSDVGSVNFDPSRTADIATELVNQRQAQLLFNASAEVVSVSDELAGKLIDEIV